MKRDYQLALATLLALPSVLAAGVALALLIDPEWARGSADYVARYRLLAALKHGVLYAALVAGLLLWFATGFFILRGKQRSLGFLALALLFPLGLVGLVLLRPGASGEHGGPVFAQRMPPLLRVGYELAVFVGALVLSVALVAAFTELLLLGTAWRDGVSLAQVRDGYNASSGMSAFGEGMLALYLTAVLYLSWSPLCAAIERRRQRKSAQERSSRARGE